jgi:Bacterial Ig-like domain (group 3)
VTTGTVDFTEGTTVLADDVALNTSRQATFTTSTLTAGSHTITATYGGTAAFGESSATVTQVVGADARGRPRPLSPSREECLRLELGRYHMA